MAPAQDFFNFSYHELAEYLSVQLGTSRYRATQLFEWVYRHGITDLDQMKNIGGELRDQLRDHFAFPASLPIHDRQISSDGTRKYLFEVEGGDLIESVMIKQPSRMTLCVSSQVGCAMGCKFCRTATMGLKRSLTTSEIIGQVRGVLEDAKHFGDSFQNIVFMGMGEPLHNFDGVTRAVRNLTDPRGFAISPRKVTVSTVGLVPAIRRLGESDVPVSLAISLNATTDEVRSEIMPVNARFPLSDLIAAIKEFPLGPRKKITIEYVLLGGVNDSADDMRRLAKLMRGLPVKINLIPYNENAGLGYKSPSRDWVYSWQTYLNSHGHQSFIRWSKGQDIGAACGQLATASKRTPRVASLKQVPALEGGSESGVVAPVAA
jgi:23S rRNA (adenine2503-C2)-methyltransferase